MNVSQVAGLISKDLGINVSESRIRRYETQGLIESVREDKTSNRVFSQGDVERLRVIVLLTELGIGSKIIKQYFGKDVKGMVKNGITEYIKDRVKSVRMFTNLVGELLK